MKIDELLHTVGDLPVFDSSLLLAGAVHPKEISRQLSRWVAGGRLVQLRRGLYAIAPPLQRIKPHPFVIANQLDTGSYVSCQSALSYQGIIPEFVPVTVSVGPGRPERRTTPLGVFEFHHLKHQALFGYQKVELGGQSAFVAYPEKALLDWVYLTPRADEEAFLRELRLNLDGTLDRGRIFAFAQKWGSKKLQRAVSVIERLLQEQKNSYQNL